jgi:hypothetical protein
MFVSTRVRICEIPVGEIGRAPGAAQGYSRIHRHRQGGGTRSASSPAILLAPPLLAESLLSALLRQHRAG